MSLRQRAFGGLFWSVVQNLGSRLIGFGILLILARLLSPEDFGLLAMATVALAFCQLFTDQGFEEVIVQRRDLLPEHVDTAFWASTLLGVAAAVALVVVAPYAARLFREPELASVLMVLSPVLLITLMSKVQVGLLRREFAFRALALRQLTSSIAGGAVAVWMAYRGFGVWSLIARQLVESVAGTLLLWNLSPWRPKLRASRRCFWEMFRFGSNLFLANLVGFLSSRADSLIVGYYLGSVSLGYYTVGQRFFQFAMDVLQTPVNQVALSVFSTMQQSAMRVLSSYTRIVRMASLVAFPVFALLIILGPDAVRVALGERWTPAGVVVQILAVGGLLFSVSYFNSTVMQALGRPSWVLLLVALNGVVNLAGFVAVVEWGIAAVSAVFVARAYLLFPLNLGLTKRLIPLELRSYLRQLLPAAIGSTIAALACLLASTYMQDLLPIWRLVVGFGVGGAAYMIALRVLYPSSLSEVWESFRALLSSGGKIPHQGHGE